MTLSCQISVAQESKVENNKIRERKRIKEQTAIETFIENCF